MIHSNHREAENEPMTRAEAARAYAEAPEANITEDEIDRLVRHAKAEARADRRRLLAEAVKAVGSPVLDVRPSMRALGYWTAEVERAYNSNEIGDAYHEALDRLYREWRAIGTEDER